MSKEAADSTASVVFKTLHVALDNMMKFIFSEVEHDIPGKMEFVPVLNDKGTRYLDFRLRRYYFDKASNSFVPSEIDVGGNARQLFSMKGGLTTEQVNDKEARFGLNVVSIAPPVVAKILLNEFNRVFYVYQNFMAWTWLNYGYWHMGIVNTIVYVFGGLTVSYVKYVNDMRLQELSKISGVVEVLRDGVYVEVEQKQLVPGDVMVVKAGLAYCDMVLLVGDAIVDESSLTGESMPIVKVPVDQTDARVYDATHHNKHNTVFAGSTVMSDETKKDGDKTLALVMKTGSHSLKGELLRDMLYGEPKKFKFDIEVKFVLIILLCYAIFGFSMTLYFLQSDPIYGFFYAVFVVASALPPLLPTVFIVAEGISADRLLRKRIVVSDTHRILMAGKVRVAFFDKTGTLTAQGMDFLSVTPTKPSGGFEESTDTPNLVLGRGMSVCHSLKSVKQNGVETLFGNAIDRKMFESSGFVLTNGHGIAPDKVTKDGAAYSILKQFDFDTTRKTQSVIVKDDATDIVYVYTKGTGEALQKICDRSTIPANFDEQLVASAKSGVYQISMGFRVADVRELQSSRDEIERGLTFAGFINFSNLMKRETPDMIRQLREGDVRVVMISGDHVLTAIYMARLSGMIDKGSHLILGNKVLPSGEIEWLDEQNGLATALPSLEQMCAQGSNIELALAGSVWGHLIANKPQEAQNIAHFVRVIGRCSPIDKITIVDCFNQQGFITMMCGDGGNDCGALRTAHVGLALSDAEASVVSPFTSVDKDIMAVVELLKEGRCTLSAAISSYKYMIMYGQVETILQIISAYFSITLSEWCWVFLDGFWVISMSFSIPFSGVSAKLAPERPTSSILGPHTMASVLGMLVINFLFAVLALGLLFDEDWFQCRQWEEGSIADVTSLGDNYESSVLFLVIGYQYVSSGIAYNFGFKHRASGLLNWRFVFFAIAWTIIHFVVILYPSTLSCFFRVNCDNDDVVRGATNNDYTPIQNPWNTTVMPVPFRHKILIICIMNAIAISLWEYVVINGPVANYVKSLFPKKNKLLGGVGYVGVSVDSSNYDPTHSSLEMSGKSLNAVTPVTH